MITHHYSNRKVDDSTKLLDASSLEAFIEVLTTSPINVTCQYQSISGHDLI